MKGFLYCHFELKFFKVHNILAFNLFFFNFQIKYFARIHDFTNINLKTKNNLGNLKVHF